MSTIIIYIFTNINKENKNQCKYPRPSERVKRPRCHGACLSLALLRLTSGAREAKSRGAWRQQIYIKRLKIQEININITNSVHLQYTTLCELAY